MADELRRLAIEQRKRAVGGIMAHVEGATWWPTLTVVQQKTLREKVLTCIGAYHDFVLDTIKVGQADAMINEETLRLVQLIHAQTQEQRVVAGHG